MQVLESPVVLEGQRGQPSHRALFSLLLPCLNCFTVVIGCH